jgi:multiple sugar transport system permease protein
VVPLYLIYRQIGWLGTHLPLIVEPALGVPAITGTFIMRQFFLGFPRELEEAARIDGLGRWGILWHIAVPLARPAMASVVILACLASWDMFLQPITFVSSPSSMLTAPVGLTLYVDDSRVPIHEVQMAATTLSVLPMLVLFFFAQRTFVQSMMTVGIK